MGGSKQSPQELVCWHPSAASLAFRKDRAETGSTSTALLPATSVAAFRLGAVPVGPTV